MRRLIPLLIATAACSTIDANAPIDAPPDGSFGGSDAGISDPIITTTGPVNGSSDGDAIGYEGIPFAAPPIGDLRWTAPQPPVPWTTTLSATSFGSPCVQLDLSSGSDAGGDEDCLTLNVWRPFTGATGLPVLVFIHGGYFVQGQASLQWHGESVYDGGYLASTGPAIVVTIQYRLGVFGFLADPSIGGANFGLLDQIAALHWVHDNAAAFGGDPARVAVFGQSAGGSSVCALLASPLAAGLFDTAMIQSGGGCLAASASDAATEATAFMTAIGCNAAADPAACARALPAEQISGVLQGTVTGVNHWRPSVDGNVLTDQPINLLDQGTFNMVPTIVGNTSDEMSGQIAYYFSPEPSDEPTFDADVASYFGATDAAKIEAEYPLAGFTDPAQQLRAVFADGLYVCPGRHIARALAAHTPTYRYIFEHAFDPSDFIDPGSCSDTNLSECGAYHFIDVPYMFHAVEPLDFIFGSDEIVLADQASQYLLDLAATGDPNGASLPTWPAFTAATDVHLDLDVPVGSFTGFHTAECDFWDSLGT